MNTHQRRAHSSRRRFLGQTAGVLSGALATPYVWTASRAQEAGPPSDRPVIALVGCGSQGRYDMRLAMPFADVAAVCDVDSARLDEGLRDALGGDASRTVDAYEDYQRVLERSDVDAVIIGTPDHWHTKIAIEALQAGKDVYCEKPLTLTIEEGQQICEAVKRYNRVFQVGTQQRSDHAQVFLKAIALVRSGRLGAIDRVTCAIGSAPSSPELPVVAPPSTLNWEKWLGQAPLVDYRERSGRTDDGRQWSQSRGHYEVRWWYEYSGGKMTDWGAHHVDIAMWALGLEETGPSKVRVLNARMPVPYENGWPTLDDRYNTATHFQVVAEFPDVEMTIRSDTENGILFEGDRGRIHVNRDRMKGKPVEELEENPLPENALVEVYKGRPPVSHMRDFINCIQSREEP
ncbi:MAG TPA: Gfo/Idh/MocA family oxidoreductase, partial [Lacipirellulaceae bacterium]|nr:Gfo/Idh/MocA family oxidoreductase [Lacipirellulaceae bacterium]